MTSQKKLLVAAIGALFAVPMAANAVTPSITQPTVAKNLFKASTQSIKNAAALTITAAATEPFIGRTSAFTVTLTLTNAKFLALTSVAAPSVSSLLSTAGGANTAGDISSQVTGAASLAVGDSAYAGSGLWTYTVAGGGAAGDTSVTYTVTPKTGLKNLAGSDITPTITAGSLLSFAAGALRLKDTTLGSGTAVTVAVTVRDPASGNAVSTDTTNSTTLFSSADAVQVTSTTGGTTYKIDVGTDATHASKSFFSSDGTIKKLDAAHFRVSNFTVSSTASTGNCFGVSGGASAYCGGTANNAADVFSFNTGSLDTVQVTVGGTNLDAFASSVSGSVYVTTTATTDCSGSVAIASASVLSATQTSVKLNPFVISGGVPNSSYQVCLKVPTSLTNVMTAQTLTSNVQIAFSDTTNLLARTSDSLTVQSLAYNGTVREVYFFNPASNTTQTSLLRVTNPSATTGVVTVAGVTDDNAQPGTSFTFSLPASKAVMFTAAELESGTISGSASAQASSVTGKIGTPTNAAKKWHLTVTGEFANMAVQSVTRDANGTLSNMSSLVDGATAQNAN